MEEIEAVARQFVRLAGTSGPVLSLACLTLFSFVWAFYFTVRDFVFFLAGWVVRGFCLSLTEKKRKRTVSFRVVNVTMK